MLYGTLRQLRSSGLNRGLFLINYTFNLVLLLFGQMVDVNTIFLPNDNQVIERIEKTSLSENVMRFKQNVTQNSVPGTPRCSVEFHYLEQTWSFTFGKSCVDRCLVRLTHNYRIVGLLRCPPTFRLRLDQPLIQWEWPTCNLVWFMYGKRALWRHLRNEICLSLACTRVDTLKRTRLINQTVVSCSLQRSSGSSRNYMHWYLVHTILLPEHTQSWELVIHTSVTLLLTDNR